MTKNIKITYTLTPSFVPLKKNIFSSKEKITNISNYYFDITSHSSDEKKIFIIIYQQDNYLLSLVKYVPHIFYCVYDTKKQ